MIHIVRDLLFAVKAVAKAGGRTGGREIEGCMLIRLSHPAIGRSLSA
jgi:hypothetical protein